jgi:signal peptidase II
VDLRVKAYGAATAVFALDRLTKWLIETHVSFLDTFRVIPGFFDIVRTQNPGIAFSLFSDSPAEWRTLILPLFALAAVVVVAGILWRPERLDRFSLAGLTLILGGAAGNLFDRIIRKSVTDFLDVYVGDHHWPTFNVADSAVVIGSGLLLLEVLRPKRQAANVP